MVVLHQLPLYLRINVPFSGLASTQVGENELRSFLRVILLIIVIEQLGTVARLVVNMI